MKGRIQGDKDACLTGACPGPQPPSLFCPSFPFQRQTSPFLRQGRLLGRPEPPLPTPLLEEICSPWGGQRERKPWKGSIFPRLQGASHPVWCVRLHFTCGDWSECVRGPMGCWHAIRGVCLGMSLMCVCGGQHQCGLLNTLLVTDMPT